MEETFGQQFSDLTFDNTTNPVSSNGINSSGTISRLDQERDLALKGNYSLYNKNNDMTYGITDEKNFVHNNMVPFLVEVLVLDMDQNRNIKKN